ncbi:MAG: ParB/RepB/Spo0J family partition protein [Bacilli bacterium]|nr:ParB/RepB/Spo0J family partition protein [Bacilli bacterium]
MENSIELQYVNIEDLLPGQFQAHFENIGDNLDNLINSIQKYGIIIPLIVRKKGINQYEIILGNRRYSAARQIGLKQIPVIIINVDDEKALDIIISENIQRKELSAKEEAYLYEKDLEYTNNNEEKLSNKLGIPIDRILSKLNFIRKNNQATLNQPLSNNNTNVISNIQTNSSINQDIISLVELNKEEREDFNMNNDIINNQNLNTDPSKTPQQPQEPTFGGRFFPSLEDSPTNMNMNQNIDAFNNNSTNQQSSPLIDLTGDNNETDQQTPEFLQTNNQVSLQNSTDYNQLGNTQEIPDIQQEQPIAPNLDVLSTNIIDNKETIQNNNISQNSELTNNFNESTVSDETNQNINNDMLQSTNNISQSETPPINNSINNLTENSMENPNTEASINTIPDNTIPSPIDITNENSISTANTNDSTPEIVQQSENIQGQTTEQVQTTQEEQPQEQNIVANVQSTINEEKTSATKDIIPVVNMIKSLAVNIENLGYKLNITESNNEGSYEINIEVEK